MLFLDVCQKQHYHIIPQEGAAAENGSRPPANRTPGCGALFAGGRTTNPGKSGEQVGASVSFPDTASLVKRIQSDTSPRSYPEIQAAAGERP